MANEILLKDDNTATVAGGVTDDSNQEIRQLRIDDVTKGLKVLLVGGMGAGTLTSITAGTGLTATPVNPIVDSGTISLADTAVTPGSYTLADITIDAQGRITSASNGSAGSGTVTSVSVVSANGLSGTVANATTTPAITLSTTITGLLKGNGTAISAATSGTDYAPATSGSAILYGDGAGGFSSVSIGSGISFTGGSLSATGSGGSVTTVSVATANGFAGTVANATTTPAITVKTTITGILQGNGTAISAATTIGSGSVVLATSPTLVTPILGTPTSVTLTNATGLPLTTGVTGTLPVANGGTGDTSATAYAVLCGGTTTTSPFQSIASVGTVGQVLTSNGAGALPTMQNLPSSSGEFFQQQIPITIGANQNLVYPTSVITGIVPGGDFYVCQGGDSSGTPEPWTVQKITMDSNTNAFYQALSVGSIGSFLQAYPVVIGSFVYVSESSGSPTLDRFDIGTLTSQTSMTVGVGGTGFAGGACFTDGTFFYAVTATSTVDKYSISGTNLTWVSTITFTSMVGGTNNSPSVWSDGTSVYQGTKKWAITGGASTTVANPTANLLIGASPVSINTIMYNFTFVYAHGTGVDIAYLLANPITYQ